jgi:hypothetical protein
MRTLNIMLSGLLMTGLAATANASGGKDDWQKRIPECGKDTRVVKLVDYDEGMSAASGDATDVPPVKIVTFKEKKKKGCWIDVKDLHPTQSAVGMGAAACKSGKITRKAKDGKLNDWLLEDNRWVPLVRGPGGKFYLTDHHHLSAAVYNADIPDKQKKLYAYLLRDWSTMKEDAFWKSMERENLTWLKSPDGLAISPKDLPSKISHLQDDPLRTLSAWVRGSCGMKIGTPLSPFRPARHAARRRRTRQGSDHRPAAPGRRSDRRRPLRECPRPCRSRIAAHVISMTDGAALRR